jgi:hypothetical protein
VIEMDDEVVDGLPVLAEDAGVEARRVASPSEVVVTRSQVAALALSGFVAGAATVALANRRKVAKVVAGAAKRKPLPLDVLSSRSFLVDVHLLRRS